MDSVVVPLLHALGSRERADASLLVRVAALKGFGLREGSDGLVVHRAADGPEIAGVLLGGMADAAVARAVSDLADTAGRTELRVPITDAAADAAGMVCGGTAHLLLTPIGHLPAGTEDLLATATPLALVCRADGTGEDSVVTRRDALGSPLGEHVLDAARSALAEGVSQTTTIEGDDRWIVATVVPATRSLVVGAGPMADAIAAQGHLLGWTTTIGEDLDLGRDFLAGAGPADALIVLSHDRSVDVPLLDAALRSSIGYIGAMGSRGTQTARRSRLEALGFEATDLTRIHGPVGLDLGSRTPSETAVAIAAEFLANRSGRAPSSLTAGDGPINR